MGAMDIVTVIVNIAWGLACAAVPVYFGYKNKLYHYLVIGAILCIAVIFFPYGMILSALCAALFYFLIKKEIKTRNEMAKRKRVMEAERELAENGESDIAAKHAGFNKNDVWPPVLINSLNNEGDENDDESEDTCE